MLQVLLLIAGAAAVWIYNRGSGGSKLVLPGLSPEQSPWALAGLGVAVLLWNAVRRARGRR